MVEVMRVHLLREGGCGRIVVPVMWKLVAMGQKEIGVACSRVVKNKWDNLIGLEIRKRAVVDWGGNRLWMIVTREEGVEWR